MRAQKTGDQPVTGLTNAKPKEMSLVAQERRPQRGRHQTANLQGSFL